MNHIASADKMVRLAFVSGLLAGLILGVAGCDVAANLLPSSREQTQKLTTDQAALAEQVGVLTQTVVNAPKQTLNELWPWIILLLGLAAMFLLGIPLILFGIAWLVRKWIKGESYLGQFEKIVEKKARACNGATK